MFLLLLGCHMRLQLGPFHTNGMSDNRVVGHKLFIPSSSIYSSLSCHVESCCGLHVWNTGEQQWRRGLLGWRSSSTHMVMGMLPLSSLVPVRETVRDGRNPSIWLTNWILNW